MRSDLEVIASVFLNIFMKKGVCMMKYQDSLSKTMTKVEHSSEPIIKNKVHRSLRSNMGMGI